MIKTFPKRNKRDEKDDLAFQNEPLLCLKKKQNSGISSVTTSFKSKKEEKKSKSVRGKPKSDFKEESTDFNSMQGSGSEYEKEKASNVGTRNKLMITKPWCSKSKTLNSQEESFETNPMTVASVSYDFRPSKNHPFFHPITYMILQKM